MLVAPAYGSANIVRSLCQDDRVSRTVKATCLGLVREIAAVDRLWHDHIAEQATQVSGDRAGQSLAHLPAATTGFANVPIRSMSTVTTSPGCKYTGGVRAKPTPGGVPVA
ncbi:MAG TPA: hypothetical protein VFJ93_15655, partial [Gaiellaceae bacterium]|nr:hypothetical protein [Gaiellaceae bacterium]